MTAQQEQVRKKFVELFGGEPIIVRSPGRINLIGEHTDYNDGFVMPAAIDKEAVFAIGVSNGRSTVHALRFNESLKMDTQSPQKVDEPKWANYLLGVLFLFVHRGHKISDFNCVFGGDIPVGAGLSSSAAIECGFAFALDHLNKLNLPRIELVKMAQWAEHNYVGVKCGIMDQYASMMGKGDHAILLDCRSLESQYAPVDLSEYSIVLCDTRVKHSLVDSEYNKRREECEEGVDVLRKYDNKINSLRDVKEKLLMQHKHELKAKVFDRCLYVVQEIERVQQASIDLKNHDLESFGKKMFDTHAGLSKLYQVSCPELDFLVDEAKKNSSVVGARMMGGGFGGCTINLVKKDRVAEFEQSMKKSYKTKYNIDMPTYVVEITDGTNVVVGNVRDK